MTRDHTCPSCHTPLEDGFRFCSKCATEIGLPCDICGSETRRDDLSCHHCGTGIHSEQAPPYAVPADPLPFAVPVEPPPFVVPAEPPPFVVPVEPPPFVVPAEPPPFVVPADPPPFAVPVEPPPPPPPPQTAPARATIAQQDPAPVTSPAKMSGRSKVLLLVVGGAMLGFLLIAPFFVEEIEESSRLASALSSATTPSPVAGDSDIQQGSDLQDTNAGSPLPSRSAVEDILAGLVSSEAAGTTITATTSPAETTIAIPEARITASIAIGESPETTIQGIRPPWASGLVVGNGSAWTVRPDTGILYRVDTGTNEVIATIEVGKEGTSGTRYSIALGFGSVFVADNLGNTVVRVDTVSNEIVATIDVGRAPQGFALSDTDVWVVKNRQGADGLEVARIDPTTNRVESRFPVSDSSLDDGQIALGDGWLWVVVSRGFDGFLFKLDPTSGKILFTIDLNCPGDLMVDEQGVRMTDVCAEPFGRRLLLIDPSDGSIIAEREVEQLQRFVMNGDLVVLARGTGIESNLSWWPAPWDENPELIDLGDIAVVHGIAINDGTVWFTTEDPARLIRVDGPTN